MNLLQVTGILDENGKLAPTRKKGLAFLRIACANIYSFASLFSVHIHFKKAQKKTQPRARGGGADAGGGAGGCKFGSMRCKCHYFSHPFQTLLYFCARLLSIVTSKRTFQQMFVKVLSRMDTAVQLLKVSSQLVDW